MKGIHIYTVGVLLSLFVAACSAEAGPVGQVTPAEESARPGPDFRPDLEPLIEGPVSPDGLKAILGTGDLGLGPNRVGFVLTSPDGFVTDDAVTVTSWYLGEGGGRDDERQSVRAEYQPWPYGNRGLYTARLEFDLRGTWRIEVVAQNPGGPTRRARLEFEVMESPSAPRVGAPAVRSVSKTVGDVESLAQLTTGSLRDADLYQTTIADALDRGKPTVVGVRQPSLLQQRGVRAPGRGVAAAQRQIHGQSQLHSCRLLRQPGRDTR